MKIKAQSGNAKLSANYHRKKILIYFKHLLFNFYESKVHKEVLCYDSKM